MMLVNDLTRTGTGKKFSVYRKKGTAAVAAQKRCQGKVERGATYVTISHMVPYLME